MSRNVVPPYFDQLIRQYRDGEMLRTVHLGHWTDTDEPSSSYESFLAAQDELNRQLIQLASLSDHQSVLDVGCGFGGTLQAIDQRFHQMELTGVNIDRRQLEICAELSSARNRYRWIESDAMQLPFNAATFDRVFCVEAMFHFASRRQFLLEVSRVLRPGGIFIASDMIICPFASDVPRFTIEAAVVDGYGPWPDFWGCDANHIELAEHAGMACEQWIDATENTFPSHQFTVPGEVTDETDPQDVTLRAALMMRWLHGQRHLRYLYLRFRKEGNHEHDA